VSSHCAILYNIILLIVLILSVTLSTTKTRLVWWKSTEYGYYDIAYGCTWSIYFGGCYNALTWYYTYTNGVYTDLYYISTYKAISSATWSSTSTRYYYTTKKCTYAPSKLTSSSTLTQTLTYSDTYLSTIINSNTLTDTDSMTYYTTNTFYSTITIKMMPSPSPKTILNDKVELNADLLLITINSWIL
jgi:hypothetical protein